MKKLTENKLIYGTEPTFDTIKEFIAHKTGMSMEEITDGQVCRTMREISNLSDWESTKWENFIWSIQSLNKCSYFPYVCVNGYTGLWNGNKKSGQLFWDIESAIDGICSYNYDNVQFYRTPDNRIEFIGHHHNGVNQFLLSAITRKGNRWIDTNYGNFNAAEDDALNVCNHISEIRCYNKGFDFTTSWCIMWN